jgi:hypothetical protein
MPKILRFSTRAVAAAAILFVSFASLPVLVRAQDLVEEIRIRHGGRERPANLGRVELSGFLEDGRGGLPFTLLIQGESSRFEIAGHVAVREGTLSREDFAGRGPGRVRRGVVGLEERLIAPWALLGELGLRYGYVGRREGLLLFSGRIERREFIGYDPPAVEVELGFDAVTRLLAWARFRDPGELGTDVEWTWGEYETVAGSAVSGRVARRLNGGPETVFRVTAVDFEAKFSEDLVRVGEGGEP